MTTPEPITIHLDPTRPAEVFVYVDGTCYGLARTGGLKVDFEPRARRLIVAMLETALDEVRE